MFNKKQNRIPDSFRNHRLMTGPMPIGQFQFAQIYSYPNTTYLHMENSNIPIENIAFLVPRSNKNNNQHQYPTPFVFDNNDNLISKGDVVVVSYTNDNNYRYLVLGSVQSIIWNEQAEHINTENADIIRYSYENSIRKVNYFDNANGEITFLLEALDADTSTGNITIDVIGTENNGNINISTTGNTVVESTKIYLCENENEDQPIVLGRTLVEQLTTVLAQLVMPSNIMTPIGPAQFNPAVVSEINRIKNTLDDMLSTQNYTR